MNKCPICKSKLIDVYAHEYDFPNGSECPSGHYVSLDSNQYPGFFMRIGRHVMTDLYAYSVKKCRAQNQVIKRWIKKERKLYKNAAR